MKDLRNPSRTRPGLAKNIPNGLAVPILSDEAVFDLAMDENQSSDQVDEQQD